MIRIEIPEESTHVLAEASEVAVAGALVNDSAWPLSGIEVVAKSCNCVGVVVPAAVPPHGRGTILLKLRPRSAGDQDSAVTLSVRAGGAEKRLSIRHLAHFLAPRVVPGRIMYDFAADEDAAVVTLAVSMVATAKSGLDSPLEISIPKELPEAQIGRITSGAARLVKPGIYERVHKVRVQLQRSGRVGDGLFGHIRIEAAGQVLVVPYGLQQPAGITAVPSSLTALEAGRSQRIVLRARDGQQFSIVGIDSPPSVACRTTTPGKRLVHVIAVSGACEAGVIAVRTTHAAAPVVAVTIKFEPVRRGSETALLDSGNSLVGDVLFALFFGGVMQ